jgi:lipoate-protein ligase A
MQMTWRYLPAEANDPAWNMAIDEAIMHAVARGDSPPTLRFYRWNPATVSIGYFQRADAELDLAAIAKQGLGFVRRPTGGRAVLHDQEVTYSVIVPDTYPDLPQSVTASYRVLSEGLLQGFRQLGFQAEMADLSDAESGTGGTAACFDSPSWYEIVVDGQKCAGSAQLRQPGVVLQHGSILLDHDDARFFQLLKFKDDEQRQRMLQRFSRKAATLNAIRNNSQARLSQSEVEAALFDGFKSALQVEMLVGALSEAELVHAQQLVEEKYGNPDYLLKK